MPMVMEAVLPEIRVPVLSRTSTVTAGVGAEPWGNGTRPPRDGGAGAGENFPGHRRRDAGGFNRIGGLLHESQRRECVRPDRVRFQFVVRRMNANEIVRIGAEGDGG